MIAEFNTKSIAEEYVTPLVRRTAERMVENGGISLGSINYDSEKRLAQSRPSNLYEVIAISEDQLEIRVQDNDDGYPMLLHGDIILSPPNVLRVTPRLLEGYGPDNNEKASLNGDRLLKSFAEELQSKVPYRVEFVPRKA